MSMGEPPMPISKGVEESSENGQENIEEIVRRLEEMNSEEGKNITKEDVEWFKSGVVEEALRCYKEALYVDEENIREADYHMSMVLKFLHEKIAKKVENWEKNSSK